METSNETSQSTESPKPKAKKRHKGLIWTIVILLILIIGVGATSVINVPGISSIFNVNKPKDLGIKASPAALTSVEQKMPVEITGGPEGLCLACKQTYEGQIPITARRTSEEITSFLQLFPREEGDILKGTQVRFIEGAWKYQLS